MLKKIFSTSLTFFSLITAVHADVDMLYMDLPSDLIVESGAAESTEPKILSRFFSAEMCEAIPKLKALHEKNPGFHKVLFKVEGFPKHKKIIVEMKRPLTESGDKYVKISSFEIQDDGTYINERNERLKYLVGTSRGFLPGEKVYVRAHTEDNTIVKEINGTPNPVIRRDSKGNIAVKAELLSVNPTTYLIELPQLKVGQEFELHSSALGQTTKAKIKYDPKDPLHYAPVAKETGSGGYSSLKIKVKSGEEYSLRMPWGDALTPYLKGAKCYPYDHDLTP